MLRIGYKALWNVRLWLRIAGICAIALMAAPLEAQEAAGVTSHNLRQYLAGATTPVTTTAIAIASETCNAAVPTTGKTAYWDDPTNAGKVCFWTDPGTGPLFAKVYGALEYTLTNLAGTVESAESAPRTPFTNPPPAPTGLHRTP